MTLTGGFIASRRTILKNVAMGSLALGMPFNSAWAASLAKEPFQGLFPIGFTPVDANNTMDVAGLAAQVTFLRRGRVPGIAWPQLASGWSVLSKAERLRGAEALVEAAKGGTTAVIIGVQSPDFADVTEYVHHAQRIGADGIICIPPEDHDEAQLLAYYQRLGKLTPLPLFLQAVGEMSVDLIVQMFETIPTMRYVKNESGEPLETVTPLLERTDGKLHMFSGRGVRTMITEMERGFTGFCPYVSIADVYQSAWEAWHFGNNKQKAFEIFGAISAVNTMFSQSSPDVLIARGVFKPGTTVRHTPPAPGATPSNRYIPADTPEEINRVLDTYLKPYLRA
jgi:4-hydroxy-tetrahydrodipicolinate synthase